MDLVTGLAATSNAITVLKALQDTEKAYDAATLKAKLADVIVELADVKVSLVEHGDRIRELEKENARLLVSTEEIGDLVEENGYRYRKEGNGLVGWPACPSCLETDRRVAFLVQNGTHLEAKCPRCTTEFSPVTSYLSPGFSRADKHKRDRDEQTRMIREGSRGVSYF